jgi:hypothetical protein
LGTSTPVVDDTVTDLLVLFGLPLPGGGVSPVSFSQMTMPIEARLWPELGRVRTEGTLYQLGLGIDDAGREFLGVWSRNEGGDPIARFDRDQPDRFRRFLVELMNGGTQQEPGKSGA